MIVVVCLKNLHLDLVQLANIDQICRFACPGSLARVRFVVICALERCFDVVVRGSRLVLSDCSFHSQLRLAARLV